MTLSPELVAPIELVIFDVDGVLTDGRIVLDDNGVEYKFFDVKDGHGMKLLQRAGVKAALLTGRESRVVAHRAEELGVTIVHQGAKKKMAPYEQIIADLGLTDRQVAYAGDDLVDLPVMRRVGLAMAPADAIAEVRAAADLVTKAAAGRGAAREMCEFILKGQGRWDEVVKRYF
jgi:3-deoxy-D-manno-octulosonate 8-phosphate phosphatase (KDO 8-P phosphatase)